MCDQIPVIDVSGLFDGTFATLNPSSVALQAVKSIDSAFRNYGAFQLVASPIPSQELTNSVASCLSRFFALPTTDKLALHLRKGGWAWRGYCPPGGEGTHGRIDQKEGFYGGPEHVDHELCGLPTYGKNLFPDEQVPEMRGEILKYIEQVTELGKTICDAMSIGLGLEKTYIRQNMLEKPDPVQLFRAFQYQGSVGRESEFGIGEHADFGLLTILSPHGPGLQFLSPSGQWTDVPYIPGAFVVNVGDILDRLSSGIYISPRHRVTLPPVGTTRLSIPFFFDPSWNAEIKPFPVTDVDPIVAQAVEARWATTTFRRLGGIWGQYLGVKVQKVFPDLTLPDFDAVSRGSTRHLIAVPKEA